MKTFSKTSLTVHIWSVFISLIIVIFLCLFVFHTIFYEQFYESFKKTQLSSQCDEIKLLVQNDNFSELDKISFNENIEIVVFNFNNDVINPIYNDEYAKSSSSTIQGLYNVVIKSNNDIEFVNEDSENNDVLIACVSSAFNYNNESYYIYINAPVVGSNIALMINQYQILFAAIITIIFGVGIAYGFSKYLSKPITELNNAAFLLSNGDYSVEFPAGGYDEIRQLGNSLNKAKDELKKTGELQRELIANVSHDLRTPLTIIQSYAEMIRDLSGENKEKREKHLEVIIAEVNRLSSLVTDVLEISKLRANKNELNLTRVNLSLLINDVLDKVKLPIQQNKINLITNLDKKIYSFVDEVSFIQVIYNFILNAITYTKDTITINLEIVENDIVFEVIDNGIGIKKEELNLIWDRYYRSKENHERHKHGSGLGLSIVKEILEHHNFKYGVTSNLNEGSNFYITIPNKE